MAQLNIGPKHLLETSSTLTIVPSVINTTFVEVPIEVIKYIDREKIVEVEKEVTIYKEIPFYIDREIMVYVDKPIEVIKEVPKTVEVFMEKLITQEVIPKWVWGIVLVEFLVILKLLM